MQPDGLVSRRFTRADGLRSCEVRDRIGANGAVEGLLDHGWVFGRDRVPPMVVGHPCGLRDRDEALLEALRGLGLVVRTGGEGFYGHGTCQVVVASPRLETV